MTEREKIVEVMAREERSRCAECGAWGPVREYHPFAYCQLVKAIGEKAARANIDAVVEYGRKLERAALEASGMAVVPVKASETMELAGYVCLDRTNPYGIDVVKNIWAAMLSAASPTPSMTENADE